MCWKSKKRKKRAPSYFQKQSSKKIENYAEMYSMQIGDMSLLQWLSASQVKSVKSEFKLYASLLHLLSHKFTLEKHKTFSSKRDRLGSEGLGGNLWKKKIHSKLQTVEKATGNYSTIFPEKRKSQTVMIIYVLIIYILKRYDIKKRKGCRGK